MQAVAVVGLGCLLPGSKTPQAFYQSLLEQRRHLEHQALPALTADDFPGMEIPSLYASLDEFFLQTLYITHEALRDCTQLNNTALMQRTGLITSTREACGPKMFELFSPVYLNELETSIQTLLKEPRFQFDYQWEHDNNSPLNAFQFSYPALLAAQTLGLGGPAFTLDAACASALYCIRFAAEYLHSGAADLMIAGGFMSGLADAGLRHYFASLGVTAEAANCRPLDSNSAGMIGNDGGGVVALKRLCDAERDGDHIYAVIDAIGWHNQSSKGKLMLAPSRDGQLATFEASYARLESRQITPEQIDFVECHATGTPVGDKIELNAMDKFFSRYNSQPLFGSLKGNIGHLMEGSGIAALIKMIYSMREGTIPATCGIQAPLASRGGRFSATNLVTENIPWPDLGTAKRPRRGAISCFGFGGTHAHMVVSEYRASRGGATQPPEAIPVQQKPGAPLALIGMGAQLGPLTEARAIADCLGQGCQTLQHDSDRLRGVENNAAVNRQFLASDNFVPGLYTDHYEFDFLRNGVGSDSRGEMLDKELLLLNACHRALQQAGIEPGKQKRVGVIVAARQNLGFIQFHLEQYLPGLIDNALRANAITLSQQQRDALIELSRDALINHSNSGFDFVATGISAIVASRIAAVWGFNGPTLKLCNLETGLLRSLQLAELMLSSDDLDAVLVAVADNDPALENRILLKKYGPALGLPDTHCVIDDSAFAFVLCGEKQAQRFKAPPLALLSDIACRPNYQALEGIAYDPVFSESTAFYGSRYYREVTASAGNKSSPGLSLATSAAMALLQNVIELQEDTAANDKTLSRNIIGEGIDKQIGSVRVTVAASKQTADQQTTAQQSADTLNKPVASRLTASTSRADAEQQTKRSLIKTIHTKVANIADVMLSDQARARFADHVATSTETPPQPGYSNPALAASDALQKTAVTATAETITAERAKPTEHAIRAAQAIPAAQSVRTAQAIPAVQTTPSAQTTANSQTLGTAQTPALNSALQERNKQRITSTVLASNIPIQTPDYYAQLFKQNCHIQQTYYTNQSLLLALLDEAVVEANDAVQRDVIPASHKNTRR